MDRLLVRHLRLHHGDLERAPALRPGSMFLRVVASMREAGG